MKKDFTLEDIVNAVVEILNTPEGELAVHSSGSGQSIPPMRKVGCSWL